MRGERRCWNPSASRWADLPYPAEEAVAVLTWYRDVAEDDFWFELPDHLYRLGRRFDRVDFGSGLLERLGERLSPVLIVFDKQDAYPIQLRRRVVALAGRRRMNGFRIRSPAKVFKANGQERKRYRKGRPLSVAWAFGMHCSTVKLHEATYNCQPQAETAIRPGGGRICLGE